jgi:hypothetical protein
MAQISGATGGQLSRAREDLISSGQRRGLGLDEIQGQMSALDIGLGQEALGKGLQVESDIFEQELMLDKAIAELMEAGYGLGHTGNIRLSEMEAAKRGEIGLAEAGDFMQAAKYAAGASEFDIGQDVYAKNAAWNALEREWDRLDMESQWTGNLKTGWNQFITQLEAGGLGQQSSQKAGFQFNYPQFTPVVQYAFNPPQQPEQKSGFGFSVFGTGVNTSCVDENALINTDRGLVRLADIAPGEMVLGHDKKYHRVIAKDCGWVPNDEIEATVRIRATVDDKTPFAGKGNLAVTVSHPINGKRADQLQEGEDIGGAIIRSIEPWHYLAVGDLHLENGGGYYANGVPVDSVLAKAPSGEYRKYLEDRMNLRRWNGWLLSEANPTGVFVLDEEGAELCSTP